MPVHSESEACVSAETHGHHVITAVVLAPRSDDRYYYALFQLPELLVLAVCATPTLLARISLVYPSPDAVPEPTDEEAASGSE